MIDHNNKMLKYIYANMYANNWLGNHLSKKLIRQSIISHSQW